MAPNLNRLTTISQQPSLRDYKPHRHTLSLSSILHPLLKESSPIVQSPSVQGRNNDIDGSFRILFYDTLSGKVKELVFMAEEDFDSSILDILQTQQKQTEDGLHSPNNSANAVASAHDADPLLCEAVLRAVYAQGISQLGLQDRQALAENVKRAFSLSEAAFREAKTQAITAARHRRAEVQAQLDDLRQDKGWLLNPNHFESFSFYEECKAHEMKELANVHTALQMLPSVSTQVQVAILSAEDSSINNQCVRRRACYGSSKDLQVYCTVKVVPASRVDDDDGKNPDYITKVAGFTGNLEWHDKSPWILLSSVGDSICVTLWKKKVAATSPYKGSKELETGSLLRNISKRNKKISWNGDTFLGRMYLPMNKIESQALSTGNIRGNFPTKSYSLSNAQKEKVMITLELEISFFCEILLNDSLCDKVLFHSPITDVEAGYSALVQVAFAMHLEGEFKLEDTWQKILSCYEAYYRLRREMCCLAVLKHLATSFQPDLELLEFITSELRPICKSAKEGKLRKPEYSLLAEVIALMIKPSLSVIEDFQSVFLLGQPEGVISKLIELLSLLLCWDPNPMEAKACFRRWVKISCVQRFNKHLTESSSDGEITSRTFSTAISLLQKDLRSLYVCLKDESPEELGLFETCAFEYYGLVSQYTTGIVGSVKISSTDLEDLTRALLLLHQELENSSMKMDFLDLHGLLRDHIIEMIAAVKPRMIDWITSSLSEEKWDPISHETDALFSYSVVDLYFMVNGVVENLTTRLSYFPFGKHYYVNLEESLCSAIETYVQITERMCLQELPSKFDEEHHNILNHFKLFHNSNSLCISKSLCVKLNNLHSMQQQHLSLEETLARKLESYVQASSADLQAQDVFEINHRESEKIDVEDTAQKKTFGHHFRNLHNLVQLALSNVTGSIIANMQNELEERLQKLMIACSIDGKVTLVMEDLEVLTKYFDDHLKALNEWLDPDVFKNLLLEIAAALIFCMEEFALNRDEDPNPMTVQQRDYLEQILNLFYSYFYGDGVGVSKSEMDHLSRRLRRILACSDLDTHELCALYWKAWDIFNEEKISSPHSIKEQEMHVLDLLLLLQQRKDDEAQIIVTNQKLLAKEQIMQIIFNLPKDEEMVASFTCRNSKKQLGTLFITAKHVSFADASMLGCNEGGSFIFPLHRLRQVNLMGHDSLSFVPYTSDIERLSRFCNREAVLEVMYNQVKKTGYVLEMYLAWICGKNIGDSIKVDKTILKRFSCSRHGLISKHRGLLSISATRLVFEPRKGKQISFVELGDISKVHAERKGLRASGVIIELKSGSSLEFVDFEVHLSPKEIALEMGKLINGCQNSGN